MCTNGVEGGNGGAGTTNGDSVVNTANVQQNAGGGGSGVGRIRINTLDKQVAGGGLQSPPASLGDVAGR